MPNVLRVALPGYNALTETNPNNLALKSDEAVTFIKEKTRGSGSLGYTSSQNVAHGLGYAPFTLVWGDDENGNLIYGGILNIFSASNQWQVQIDSTNVSITQLVDGSSRSYLYYIFYDQVA